MLHVSLGSIVKANFEWKSTGELVDINLRVQGSTECG